MYIYMIPLRIHTKWSFHVLRKCEQSTFSMPFASKSRQARSTKSFYVFVKPSKTSRFLRIHWIPYISNDGGNGKNSRGFKSENKYTILVFFHLIFFSLFILTFRSFFRICSTAAVCFFFLFLFFTCVYTCRKRNYFNLL